ncbi:MAG: hypothetical protein ACI3ZN_06035 [Candidatus Cryptobacteroides sp.]
MKKNKIEILDELAAAIEEVRNRVDLLAGIVDELRQNIEDEDVASEEMASGAIAKEMDAPMDETMQEDIEDLLEEIEDITDIDLIEEPVATFESDVVEEPESVSEPEPEELPEPASEPKVELESEDEPEVEPEELFRAGDINEMQAEMKAPLFLDVMAARNSWKNDIPGPEVKDVRSAISLNDRVLFINHLFGEDPAAFQSVLNAVNSMTSFSEAEDYMYQLHPEWNFDSDIVYRFMMAIRRKLK